MVHIYLDESGDTGWRFDHPYTKGGSSCHLIIAACLLLPDVEHMPERMLRHMYKRRGWSAHSEKKWAQMSPDARGEFASNAAKLVMKNPGIELHAIVVAKQNVKQHIQRDPNKLYNYMVKLLLLDQMAKHGQVSFVPHPRVVQAVPPPALTVAPTTAVAPTVRASAWPRRRTGKATSLLASPKCWRCTRRSRLRPVPALPT